MIELAHTKNLNLGGNQDAEILVVCDAPGQKVFSDGNTMGKVAMGLFFANAQKAGFENDEFGFVTPCPPIPEEIDGSKSRENLFMSTYAEEFQDALRQFPNVKMLIYLGPRAGRQVLQRPVKITKVRGQVSTPEGFPYPVLAMLSPANVLRRPELTETFETDFQIASMVANAGWDTSVLEDSVTKADYKYCFDLTGWLLDPPKGGVGLDLESKGGQWYESTCRVLCVQLSREEGKSIVVPLDVEWFNQEVPEGCQPMTYRRRAMLRDQLRELLGNPNVAVTGSNLSGDLHKLRKEGIEIANWAHETQNLVFCKDENTFNKGLDDSTRRWLFEMAGYADCVVPETLILTADMRKIPVGQLMAGDELCAFTADITGGKSSRRKMCKSVVLETQRLHKECLRITTQSGKQITVSNGHLFLSKTHIDSLGCGWRWRRADDLKVGNVLKPFSWEDPLTTFEAGYVSGIIDGEGWLCKGRSRIAVAQRSNVVLQKFKQIVTDAGVIWGHSTDKRKEVGVVNLNFDGHECFKVLQKFRPIRLLESAKWEGCGLPTNGDRHDEVVSIEKVGVREVVGLKTSSQTIIANGLLSHNSFNRTVDKEHMERVTPEYMLPYGGGDPDASRRLTVKLIKDVKRDRRQWNCYQRIQMPAMRTFNRVEEVGLLVDKQALRDLGKLLEKKAAALYDELIVQVAPSIKLKHEKKGLAFSRADFIIDILFNHPDGFKLTPVVWTDGTKKLKDVSQRVPSTSAKDHLPYFKEIPFVEKLIEQKKLAKMRSTYVGEEGGKLIPQRRKNAPDKYTEHTGFWKYIGPDGRIHPAYFLHRAVTGRTSSAYPNAQNFPKRGDLAEAFRKIFLPTPGYVFVEADLSQAELRIAAWMAQETNMLRIYRSGGDVHEATAAAIMGVDIATFKTWKGNKKELPEQLKNQTVWVETFDKLYKLKRYQAKAVNFGFIFGMGWRKFKTYAKTDYQLDFTDAEAQKFREVFFALYPKLADWHKSMRKFANQHGYVRALHGAVRHLPNIYSGDDAVKGECERQAINSPVQRFSSDMCLMGLIRFARDCDWEIMRPVMMVHDSIVVEVKIGYEDEVMPAIKWYMESAPLEQWFDLDYRLPVVSDISIARNNLGESEELDIVAKQPDWWQEEYDLAA